MQEPPLPDTSIVEQAITHFKQNPDKLLCLCELINRFTPNTPIPREAPFGVECLFPVYEGNRGGKLYALANNTERKELDTLCAQALVHTYRKRMGLHERAGKVSEIQLPRLQLYTINMDLETLRDRVARSNFINTIHSDMHWKQFAIELHEEMNLDEDLDHVVLLMYHFPELQLIVDDKFADNARISQSHIVHLRKALKYQKIDFKAFQQLHLQPGNFAVLAEEIRRAEESKKSGDADYNLIIEGLQNDSYRTFLNEEMLQADLHGDIFVQGWDVNLPDTDMSGVPFIDPFVYPNYIHLDKDFFKRGYYLAEIRNLLQSGQHCCVYGDSLVGKTSLVLKVQRDASTWEQQTTVIYVNGRNPRCYSLPTWLGYAARQFGWESVPESIVAFADSVDGMVNKENKHFVLCMDHFDLISEHMNDLSTELFAMLTEMPGLTLLLAQTGTPQTLPLVLRSRCRSVELRKYTHDEALAFVSMPRQGIEEFSPAEKDAILTFASGHPMDIQLMCSFVLRDKQRPGKRSGKQLDAIKQAAYEERRRLHP